MGQKVHPGGLRVGVIHDWKSNWMVGKKEFAGALLEDIKIREHILEKLSHAGLSDILIRKDKQRITIDIYTARPGIVIGKSGVEVDALRKEVHGMTQKNVHININEIKRPELDAKLVAQSIAEQLQNRVSFRRAMKRSLASAIRSGAAGVGHTRHGRDGEYRAEGHHRTWTGPVLSHRPAGMPSSADTTRPVENAAVTSAMVQPVSGSDARGEDREGVVEGRPAMISVTQEHDQDAAEPELVQRPAPSVTCGQTASGPTASQRRCRRRGPPSADRLDRAAAPAGRGLSLMPGVVEEAPAAADAGLGQGELDAVGGLVVAGERRGDGADLLVAGHGQERRGAAVGLHPDQVEAALGVGQLAGPCG